MRLWFAERPFTEKKEGVRTVMLTGDNERVAKAIAHQLDIDEYYSELLPLGIWV